MEIVRILRVKVELEEVKDFEVDRDSWLRKNEQLVVPDLDGLRGEVMMECHRSRLTTHLDGNKMRWEMKHVYYWESTKRDIRTFISKCLNC